jgi:hypothetical protein
MNHLKSFKLFEIASITEPNITYSEAKLLESYFEFKIDKDTYFVFIFLNNMFPDLDSSDEILSIVDLNTIEISFDMIRGKKNTYKLTNKNTPLKVLSNLIGVIKHWSLLNLSEVINDQEMNLKDVNISYISIDSKRETEDDLRRNNIYNYYIEKFINSKILNKENKKQVSSNTLIPIRKFKTYRTIYEIEPTNVTNLININ